MTDNSKAVINLTTGHEDADKVTIAFLVATAALAKGKQVAMFLTKEAVRLGLPGYADAIESAGAPHAPAADDVQAPRLACCPLPHRPGGARVRASA